ncbi:MAG: hypothetical protein II034_00800, partial [Muribaculaceae bacterium]|nr:hypothetical protein [Muribaculaceae bacterium]
MNHYRFLKSFLLFFLLGCISPSAVAYDFKVDGLSDNFNSTETGLLKVRQNLTGDVNGDGRVNVSDVSALINMILGLESMNQESA